MLIERIIFNLLAFTLFIFMFFKIIRKNDTSYIVIICIQALGIAINFIELIANNYFGNFIRILTYVLSILIPIIIIGLEYKGINFPEIIYVNLSRISLFFGNSKKAKALLIKLVNKYNESYTAHKLLAEIYEKEGGMRKAIDEYVKVIDINKKDYDSYYKIAYLLEEFGKKEESIVMLNNLIKKKPDYYKASELLGNLLCEQENFKEAISVYMNALKYNPENYDIYYNLGIAYTRLNDFQNAKICYEKAAMINSELYNGYYNLGMIALIYDDIDEAEKFFNESIKGEDIEADSYYNLSKIYALKGEKEKAINFLNLAIELDKTFAKKASADPVFIPIQRYIHLSNNQPDSFKEINMEEKEKKAKEHLEYTYSLVGKLSLNDIKKMNNYNNKEIELEQEQKEREQ